MSEATVQGSGTRGDPWILQTPSLQGESRCIASPRPTRRRSCARSDRPSCAITFGRIGLEVVRPSWHQLEVHAPAETLIRGMEHLIWREWGVMTPEPEGWDEPGYVLVPAADIDLIKKRHPGIDPFSPVAVARMPIVGKVTAPWCPGFDPAAVGWKGAENHEFTPFVAGRPFSGETVGQHQWRAWGAFDRGMVDAEGTPLGPTTLGRIECGPTIATRMETIGKESRGLGIGRGILGPPDTAHYVGDDGRDDAAKAARRLSKDSRLRRSLAALARVSERELRYFLAVGERRVERPGTQSSSRSRRSLDARSAVSMPSARSRPMRWM